GGGQGVEGGEEDAGGRGGGGGELRLGVVGQPRRPEAVGGVERLTEELARLDTPVAPPEQRAEVGQHPRSLENGVAALECSQRLPKQELSALATGRETGRTQGHAERARRTEGLGELDLLLRKTFRRLHVAEGELRARRRRAPRQEAGTADQTAGDACAYCKEVLEAFVTAPLREPKTPAGKSKNCGRERPVGRLSVDRGERVLGRPELPLLDQRLHEQAAVLHAVDRRRRQL